jgi:hypothetical protein
VDAWTVGLVGVIVVGLATIIYGALSDRARNKRAAAAILAPPDRPIPRFAPDSPAPQYLTELQARRMPERAEPTDLDPVERTRIAEALKADGTAKIDAGYLASDFVTDPTTKWAVLAHPRVLVCDQGVETVRELLAVLEKVIVSGAPLVIAAPAFSAVVQSTLLVNMIQRRVRAIPVAADSVQLVRICATTGAARIARSDLQSGYVPFDVLGRCGCWVSTATASYVIEPTAKENDPQ